MTGTEVSTSGHAFRVAAIATELAITLGLDQEARRRIYEAALWHELPFEVLSPGKLDRLAADLGVELAADVPSQPLLDPPVAEILHAFRNGGAVSSDIAAAIQVLQIADRLDEKLEREPYSPEADQDTAHALFCAPLDAGLQLLRCCSRDDLLTAAECLPVFPAAVVDAVHVLLSEESGPHDVEKLATRDPVLAGSLLSAANSPMFAARQEIKSVFRAVMHLGLGFSKRVLVGTIMRGIFGAASLRPHWNHALEAADAAAHLAGTSGVVSTAEASLAGLVHDVGLIAIAHLNADAASRRARLIHAGLPRTAAEWIVCGFDHAEASAAVLEAWRFPQSMIEAVRHHHAPERCANPLAALLYLVEFWTCAEEDHPSHVRLAVAARRAGLNPQEIATLRVENQLTRALASFN